MLLGRDAAPTGQAVRQSCASHRPEQPVPGGSRRNEGGAPDRREVPAHVELRPNCAGCPRPESNQRTRFRKPLLYPLSYGGAGLG
jgi:hypothetical protein